MLPTQLVRQPQGMQLAKALGAVYYRPSSALFVDEWSGSCPECDKARDAGLQLVLTVRANGRGQATSPPSDLAAYQRTLSQVLDTYPPSLLVVENEENSTLFYVGTPEEYAAQLQAACQVAHAKGIPCTNGGLVSTLVALLVYHHYLETGQTAAAQDFAQRVFTPQEQALLDSPQAQEQVRKGKAFLASYRPAGANYVNFHWYIADTQALGEAVAYLASQTGLPALTNEIGQHNDDPNQTTAVMGKVVELALPVAVWFSVDAAKARALVNPDGSLRPTGEAFQRFIAEHFGLGDRWRSPRRHLSREPKRVESLWWIVAEALTETNGPVVERAIQQWQEVGTFDAFVVGILPPTFYDFPSSVRLVNQANQWALHRLVAGFFPTGTEGWETSSNEDFARRLAPLGVRYDPGRSTTREQWLESLSQVAAPTWAYVLEQLARTPTHAELVASGEAFLRRAREERKSVVLWFSAMMLRQPESIGMVQQVWTTLEDQVDEVVWMDLPIVSQEPGQSLESLLRLILSFTSVEKVRIQYTHNPNLPTKDPSGTLDYIAICQRQGINRFVLLASPFLLQQEPWNTFYRNFRHQNVGPSPAQDPFASGALQDVTRESGDTFGPVHQADAEAKTNMGTAEGIEQRSPLLPAVARQLP